MYVVKVGEYYVRSFQVDVNEIGLSQEIMRSFNKNRAEMLAKRLNGEVIKMSEETTCE